MWKRLLNCISGRMYPIQVAEDIFLTGCDRDNWFVRKGIKSSRIYAPASGLWPLRLDFHGVSPDRWDAPFQHEPITPEDKQQLEQALMGYFTRKRIRFVVMVDDPNEPVRRVINVEP